MQSFFVSHRVFSLLFGAACLSTQVAAAPLATQFVDTVTPDAELTAFLVNLVETAQRGLRGDDAAYRALDGLVAPDIRGFSRGLDPLEPWRTVDLSDATAAGVDLLTSNMVEMGELPQGSPIPDYRPRLLELLVSLVANPHEPLGTMAGVDAVACSPARLGVDVAAATSFAKAHDTDGSAIYFYPTDLALYDAPDAGKPAIGTLAAGTLLLTDYEAERKDGWDKVVSSDGRSGWSEDRSDYLALSQQHLCFGKVGGTFKITAFYTYGL
jgi:hypothetical protein